MSILHMVNKSPFENQSLRSCIDHASDGDAILMIEDAVYGAVAGTAASSQLAAGKNLSIFALGPDLEARGITKAKLATGLTVVDYNGFVDLAVEYDKTLSWL